MADKNKNQGPDVGEPRLTRFEEYLYANLMAWAFLAAVAAISFFTCGGVWDEVTSGVILKFLFLIVGGGMALVSAMDYFYDRYMSDSAEEGIK